MSLFANQTEIIFKKISVITFKLVDIIKTLRNTISNLTHDSFPFNITTFLYHFILQHWIDFMTLTNMLLFCQLGMI